MPIQPLTVLRDLSDDTLIEQLKTLVERERAMTLAVVLRLVEVERRGLHLSRYSSLFAYCTDRLRYSPAAAGRRIRAARCVRDYPRVYDMLLDGSLNLTTLCIIARVLTPENDAVLLPQVAGKPQREVEKIVAAMSKPRKPVDRVRPIRLKERDRRSPCGDGAAPVVGTSSRGDGAANAVGTSSCGEGATTVVGTCSCGEETTTVVGTCSCGEETTTAVGACSCGGGATTVVGTSPRGEEATIRVGTFSRSDAHAASDDVSGHVPEADSAGFAKETVDAPPSDTGHARTTDGEVTVGHGPVADRAVSSSGPSACNTANERPTGARNDDAERDDGVAPSLGAESGKRSADSTPTPSAGEVPSAEPVWYRVELTVDETVRSNLDRARSIISRGRPNASLSDVFGRLLEEFLRQHDPEQRAARREQRASVDGARKNASNNQDSEQGATNPRATNSLSADPASANPASAKPASAKPASAKPASVKPASAQPPSTDPPLMDPPSTHAPSTNPSPTSPSTNRREPTRSSSPRRRHAIPAAVRDQVWCRYGGRCAHVGSEGRCPETLGLNIDHIIPVELGGSDHIDNLRLLCSLHNQWAADVAYGKDYMESRRRRTLAPRVTGRIAGSSECAVDTGVSNQFEKGNSRE